MKTSELERLKQDVNKYRKKCKEARRKLIKMMALKRTAMTVSVCLLLAAVGGFAVQPLPNGVRIQWDASVQSGWSNWSYSVWMQPPNTSNWLFLVSTTNTQTLLTNSFPAGTMYGVTSLAVTNGSARASDVGVAPWPPDIRTTNQSVRLIPESPWRVPTNVMLSRSTDLKTFTARERYHIAGSNVLVEHFDSAVEPRLFFAVPKIPQTVSPPPSPK